MKTLRRFCAIVTLTLVFALPVLADGQMEFPVNLRPQSQPPPGQAAVISDGQMEFPVCGADPVTEITLSIIQGLLPYF